MRNPLNAVESASIPEGWRIAQLSAVIAEINGGFSVNCEDRAALANEIGVLKTGAVALGVFDPTQHKCVVLREHHRVRTPVSAGTIIFCRKHSEEMVGGCALVRQDRPNLFLSDLLWEIRPSHDVSLYWLEALMKSHLVASAVRLRATGTQSTMKNISQDRLLSITVPIAPASEQVKIAEILGTWDEGISVQERVVAAAKKRHAMLRDKLFMADFGGANWKVHRLEDIVQERNEKSDRNNQYPVLTSSRRGLFLQEEYFSRQITSSDNTGYKIVRRGDFTYRSMSDDDIFKFNQQQIVETGIISPAYGVFTVRNVDPGFFYNLLNASAFRKALLKEAQGGTRTALRFNALRRIPVALPTLEVQKRVGEALALSAHGVNLEERRLVAVRQQKRGLMQKLLTGELRVKARVIEAGAAA